MSTIRINEKNRTIELMSKKFATAASKYGTPEYMDLQAARRDYPNYKVVVKSTSRTNSGFKGLTYEYMEKYIKSHGTEAEKTEKFNAYKNIRLDVKCLASATAYREVKKWFLEQYPEVAEYGEKKPTANKSVENESTEITLAEKKSA
ncbi:MAG: hypothetical protein IJ035_06280 [Oscillospiraceae bacterium]|nr:hypothetical protein [Oscillospiraceae bacterium]